MILTREFLKSTPQSPGIYKMLDKSGGVLYVGKAKNLRKRLTSYVKELGSTQNKTGVMLSQVVGIETILTATEKEALILEASLIKKHKPKYNIILRDDKSYPFIKVTVQEKWPRLIVTRRKLNDKARYYGPFSSSSAMWGTVKHLNSLFPLRRCRGKVLKTRKRPCINCQINKCFGPCTGNISEHSYKMIVDDVLLALSGRNKDLIAKLNIEMNSASQKLEFERAAIIRDKISSIRKTMEKQSVAAFHHKNQDIFGFERKEQAVAISVLLVRDGVINGKHSYLLADTFEDNHRVFAEVIARYYAKTEEIPDEVLLPFLPEGNVVLEEWLNDRKGSKVYVKSPQRGFYVDLIRMAQKNAKQLFSENETREGAWKELAGKIKNKLVLDSIPNRMICMDISHFGGEQTVGAVVSFLYGLKESKFYRHYLIKDCNKGDDYAAMAEVARRHLLRAQDAFLPNLLIVDGGKGQLGIALKILKELGLDKKVELAGIAKEKGSEGEKVYRPGRKNPIKFARNSPVLLLLMKIRDEAHRFGITFHRKKRHKKAFSSSLDCIPGVGPMRKKSLLKQIGSFKRIESARIEDLSAVAGIGPELAGIIWHHFHQEG